MRVYTLSPRHTRFGRLPLAKEVEHIGGVGDGADKLLAKALHIQRREATAVLDLCSVRTTNKKECS
jgi:hypothetical protein